MIYVIIIKHAEFSYSLIESELLLTHQPAAVNFMHLQSIHTPYLQHLSNWRRIWNPAKHLWWSFFVETVNVFRQLTSFAEEICQRCLILDVILISDLLWLAIGLRGSFPSLGLHKGIWDSPWLLILLIYTKHKAKRWNFASSFHFSETMQILHSTCRVALTHNRKKPAAIGLTIYKYPTRTKWGHLTRNRSEEKLSKPWGNKRKSWTHLPSPLSGSTPEP